MTNDPPARIWTTAAADGSSTILRLPVGEQPPLDFDGACLRWPASATLLEIEEFLATQLRALRYARSQHGDDQIYWVRGLRP